MNSVGADFVKYIKSFPANTDFNAKDVIQMQFYFEIGICYVFDVHL